MIKTIAIPARLQRPDLTDAEKAELATFGNQPMTYDEIAAITAQQAADAAAAPRRALLAQIAALEAQQTPRRMREALKDGTFIDSLDAQIATLRGKL